MAKILADYVDGETGATCAASYWNAKYYPVNVRAGQESVVFHFDGFASKEAREAGRKPMAYAQVTVPRERIPAYMRAHLVDRLTLPELAYAALGVLGVDGRPGFFEGGKDDVDSTVALIKS